MRRYLLVPLVLGLFGLAFVESWAALVQAAEAAAIPYPIPWPFMVDGFIVATALLVVEARRTGHTWGAWWPRLGLLGATALSTTIQVAYAPVDNWARALHGWSPLAVLASFECLVWLVFSTNTVRPDQRERAALLPWLHQRIGAWSTTPAPVEAPVRAPTAAPVRTPVRSGARPPVTNGARRPVRALTVPEQRRVDALVAKELAPFAIANQLKIPYAPVRRYVRDLEAKVSTNGDRP